MMAVSVVKPTPILVIFCLCFIRSVALTGIAGR